MPHPYASTIPGLLSLLEQLRTSFPASITADTLKKWGIASNNEGPIISVIRFLGLIDKENNKVTENSKAFVQHDDGDFQKLFEPIVKNAYKELFELNQEKAWTLDRNKLIGYFRQSDNTSARVGLQ